MVFLKTNMDTQKTTSKTSLLNRMLMKAWRERWTDCQWGINIKTVLPRGVSGDVYNLADCILQQAVVGSGANQLVLSYLRHSLCSHLVSHAAVLKRISKYDGLDKPHCIFALLEFLESIISGVTCRGKTEETMIVNSVTSVVLWLMQVYATAARMPSGEVSGFDWSSITKRVSSVMESIVQSQFLMGILYLGKQEDAELFGKIGKKYQEIVSMSGVKNSGIEEALKKVTFIELNQLEMIEMEPKGVEAITYCLQPLLAVEVLLNPSSDTQIYVNQLLMIQRLKGYSAPRLYCELIRACLISLNNVSGPNRESMWCAFTFIKVPHILKQLNALSKDYDEKLDYSPDVIEALEMLLEDAPVLDFMDTKCVCNTIECFMTELLKQHLVTEKQIGMFSARRESITSSLQKLEINNQQPSIVKFVLRAEPPLAGILKTLSTDYNKVQEALLSMLCQVLSGNSFELILSVATVEGKLKTFVSRLIKCNECSKQVPGETGKAALTRAALFDVSFLMLTFIVQTFGSDVVLDEGGDSFFEKWVRECMVERNKCKPPMAMVQQCDQVKVDELLLHLHSPDSYKVPQLKWHEVCNNIPGVLYHVLLAWENGQSPTDVKNILDNMKVKLCAYSVCAASWLCSYLQIVCADDLLKPMNMVQQFLTAIAPEEMAQQENFKERLGLTFQIIRKMQHDFHPAGNAKMRMMLTHNLVSSSPLAENFGEVWKSVQERGWLPVDAAQTLESLMQSCGPLWLVTKLVQEIFACRHISDMLRVMDIAFAIMHLDIEQCTVALLEDLLPMLLLNKLQCVELMEPHSSVVARLCVCAILATLETPGRMKKKRSRTDQEDIETLCPPPKVRKLNPDLTAGDSCSSDMPTENLINREPPATVPEPLAGCFQSLLKMFATFVTTDEFSPKVHFIFHFLVLLVQCGRDRVKPLLRLLPPGFVQNLLKIIVTDDFTPGLILRLYDLQASRQGAVTDLCLLRNIQLRKESIRL
ncbi:mediator of RNA polymerase II transcription subunit 24 [Phlebotomus argentipes]|uniref:mediator of RNA polymerase II transcription subunit 24 n=1 Tax=Phlebotomus argentipes TaxID=94469 RepID=UPI002892C52A|nr:mediator of RNA polymerase II transcription subunit 24 [Phlebotomus argentipes]